mgnify:CR=1 FL=1
MQKDDLKNETSNSNVIKSLPSDAEIHKQSLIVCEIEAELVQAIAWYYHDKGAKWMKEEVIKQGNVL